MKKLWKLKISPYNSGRIAEFICRLYMILHGYRIVEKNYRINNKRKTIYGEVDFIAQKGKKLYFCEVKKRKNKKNFMFALTPKQQQRIMLTGENFLKSNKKYKNFSMQFDVFFIILPFNIKRVSNALYYDRIR